MAKARKRKFLFLPHTADAKFRAYGKSIEKRFANAAIAMTSIMFECEKIKPRLEKKIAVQGNDLKSLLYNWLEEFIYLLDTKNFILHRVSEIKITKKNKKHVLKARVKGDTDLGKYESIGNAVKAVTYNEMEITKSHVQVVVDI